MDLEVEEFQIIDYEIIVIVNRMFDYDSGIFDFDFNLGVIEDNKNL